MYKFFRIAFCIIAVAAAAVAVPIFIFFDLWGLVPVGAGLVCALLMFLFKYLQEQDEIKKNPPEKKGDFITGKVEDDK